MVHTEIQFKNGKKYYYRTLSVRDKDKFRKVREYLGVELSKKELAEKEAEADPKIRSKAGLAKKIKIGERQHYKQSGAGLAITIGLPMYTITKPKETEEGLTILYKGDMIYSTPDLQFLHYFIAEDLIPTANEIFRRMEENPNWMKKRISDFKTAVSGLEDLGEELIQSAVDFDKEKTLKIYEKFLKRDYNYWITSVFIDLFDALEDQVLNFIFRDKVKFIDKEDMQFLLLPNRSVFWKEKDDFDKIRTFMKKNKLKKTDKKLWEKLKEHSKKYWWMSNDYQTVRKLGASDFMLKLDENSENPFWKTSALKKKELIKKYALSEDTIKRLEQFAEMAYLRDIRKQYTQIANYAMITFYHTVAKKIGIPEEWSNFVVPFSEYKQFLEKDKKLLKELELRTKTGVWVLGDDVEWRSTVESSRSKELFSLVEGKIKGGELIYGSIASLGKGTGKAKIILRQSDFDKFEDGDILITGMTRPEFVPLMKRASAIVTDEGGITCHAAIISRELSKPCVIGTQSSTKTFKDGDLLEVNANHGYVKKLKNGNNKSS
jgi:phosphohistidine swiveling domain-containing protein